jgi:hypothetical protein
MRSETSRVSFLMCPFCVRALIPREATRLEAAPTVVGKRCRPNRPSAHLDEQQSSLRRSPTGARSYDAPALFVTGRAVGTCALCRRRVHSGCRRRSPSPGSDPDPWQEWQGSAFARVRSCSLTWTGNPAIGRFERTGANGCERSLAFAMQKVVGSSPIIRSESPCNRTGCVVCCENRASCVASFGTDFCLRGQRK